MKRIAILLTLALCTFGVPRALDAATAIEMTPEIEQGLKKAETYLDGIKTMQAEFLQISSSGDTANGKILLSRPKNLRIEYDPPTPILIVADGEFLSYVDTELKQVNHIPIEDTPAAFLLRDDFSFTGPELTVTRFERRANTLRISAVQTKDPLAGELTLVFTENPMVLRKWVVIDAQGVITDLTLINARFDYPIPESEFLTSFPELDLEGR
ncbi:MAG: outer membrane lipoprotein carrier protein LolA [Rhodospirillales bacterium]|nr:outer membrane lipoprotein carrier protein LolA [Rhodospirillales bacterium]MBO6787651.1 outer membrane lipoprotein carrier protein LolA [Rhodospirillales bacterium]